MKQYYDISGCHVEVGFVTFEDREVLQFQAVRNVMEVVGPADAAAVWADRIGAVLMTPAQVVAHKMIDVTAAIKAERDRRKHLGVFASGKWFHSDVGSRIQQLGLMLLGASVPAIPWDTLDGTAIQMSQPLAAQIFLATAMSDQVLHAAAKVHIAAAAASDDPEIYDFKSAGWPPAFGE